MLCLVKRNSVTFKKLTHYVPVGTYSMQRRNQGNISGDTFEILTPNICIGLLIK